MKKRLPLASLFILIVLVVLLAALPQMAGAEVPAAQDLQEVWELVRQAGSYEFSGDITQIIQVPAAPIQIGPTNQKTRMHMEGETDLTTGFLNLTLWNAGGSIALPETGTQIRIADGVAQARRGAGPWQEIDDFSGPMAPGGDFLGILSAMDNVVRHDPETYETLLGEQTITRFTFDVNGRRYAEYIRGLLTEQMSSRGELPPGVKLDLPEVYTKMTGRGELWIGADGLPLRQGFELTFPESQDGHGQGQSTVQGEINFTRFGSKPADQESSAKPITPTMKLPPAINQALQYSEEVFSAILATMAIILLVILTIFHSRSRRVYALVALTVSISMLISPILSSSTIAAYNQRQIEKQAATETRQVKADNAEAWQEALSNPNFDPHTSPFNTAQMRQQAIQAIQAGSNHIYASDVISTTSDNSTYFDSSCETDPGSDNDGDSLTNLEECLIGTLPGAVDTDQDGVNDDLEVKGFVYGDNDSVIWYTNPLHPDTNRDGLGDGNEWYQDANNDGMPDDTDLDGIPDLWDDDNDGDGVPDDLDLSPYDTTMDNHVFNGDSPLQLIVDDVGEGLISKVEFQLTPTNPDHLWYTNNVLDWADNDRQGQMQDADGLTFYDVDSTVDPWPNDLGDVRLVPILEIEITSTSNNFNLPDDQTLEQFGITVHDTSADTKTAYVPVSLVTDNIGNKNVAFQGAMFYQAGSSWGTAHTVRLVWLVQALVDVCETYKNGICDTYSEYNDLQIIHSYDEEWYLTGMEISEERGTNMAVIYEDPVEADNAPLYMDTLYELAYGLDRTFMAGADCETLDANNDCVSGDGNFDLTVDGIYSRFNHATNSAISDEQRWGLSNVLSVQTNSYSSVELAMMDTVITQTSDILTDTFTSAWSASSPITPTIMFAWEHNYRAVSLGSDHLSWAGNILTADIASSGTNPVQVEQENGMKWAPYAYNSTDGWFAVDLSSFWEQLDILLPDSFSGDADVDTEVASAKFLYMGMNSGETHIVRFGDQLIPQDYESGDLPIQLKIASYTGSGIRKGVAIYFGDVSTLKDAFTIIDNEGQAPLNALEKVALKISNYIQKYTSLLEKSIGLVGIGLLIVTSIAALIVAGIYLYRKYVVHDSISSGLFIAATVAMATLAFVVGVIKPVLSIIKTVNGLIEVGAVASKAEAIGELFKGEGAASLESNILGLIISVSISVAFFVTLLISGQVKPGSISAQYLAAQTIASIITAYILFILALNPFTAILVGLAAIIDIILFALGVNFSITGKLTEVIANALYEFDLSVDSNVNTGSIETELVIPADGMVAGNQMIFSMPITTVITQSNKVDINEDDFRSNSFVYDLAALDAYQSGLATTHGDRASEWSVVDSSSLGYIGTISDTVSYEATLAAGINRSFVFYLDSAYDLLGESCWWILGCKEKYVAGSDSTEVGSSLVFDIYPATVEEFMDLTAWSTGNLRIADADGDGLLPLGAGGVDPDDTTWDTDGDSLSDQFELSMRALTVDEGGEVLDATLMDTDGDGIPDNEELWLATNPNNADSDGDGIPDVEEAARADTDLITLEGGWLFSYSINNYTRVWSDPNNADYDGDGMTDLFELTQDTCPDCTPWADPNNPLLFSPYVYNENPVPIYLSDNTNDGFVTPGASFVYSTTTENNLSEGILLTGDVALSLPNIFAGAPLSAEVALTSGYSETLASELSTAVSNSAIGVLTSTMNLSAFEDVVWSWDPPESDEMSPIAGDIQALDATAAPGFSDLYVYTALEIDDAGTQYITVYAAGNDGNPSASNILSSIGASAGITYTSPSVACNDDGVCVVAWGEPDYPNGGIINGFMLNGNVSQTSILSSIRPSEYDGITLAAPSVATDGDNFMVGWTEDTGSQASTWVRQVNADGTYSSLEQVWEINNHGSNPLGLVWTGSKYLAVWIDGYNATMYRAEIDTSLNVGPVTTVLNNVETFPLASGADSPLPLSYDLLSNQALVIYRDLAQNLPSAFYISARLLSVGGLSPLINLDISEKGLSNSYADTAVCADPQNGGWLVAWTKNGFNPDDPTIHYQAIGPDGSLRGSEQIYSVANTNAAVAIACRAPHPLVDLEFEENASSTVFADSSQYENDATCTASACPLGGVGGRFGNGVQFDGVDDQISAFFTQPTDEFTAEFWLKTTCQNCGILSYLGGNSGVSVVNGEICVSTKGSLIATFDQFCTPYGINYADGDWHHVIHAADDSSHLLYVDGEYKNSQTVSYNNIYCSTECDRLQMGLWNTFFVGTLDQVRMHNRRLSTSEMTEAFSAAVTILDLDEAAGSTTAYDSSNNGFNASCSGTSCPTFGVDGAANTGANFDGSNDYLTVNPQARTLDSIVYDFEDNGASNWDNGTISSATREGASTKFLGDFGNQTVTLNLSNLPTHDTVSISFDLYVLGPWAGNRTDLGPDIWQWGHDEISLLNTTFSNQPNSSPNYQTYPAGYPYFVGGITLYENSDYSGTNETFTEDDPDLSNNPIGNDRASAYVITGGTASILYKDSNYSSTSWIMDPERGNNNVPDNDVVSSLRVFSALHSPKYGSTGDSLTAVSFAETSVYHIEYTLDDHTASTLSLFFEGLASSSSTERWGLDNVVVEIQSADGSIPLTNSDFTLSAWVKRDSTGSDDFIISQGTGTAYQGLNLSYRSSDHLRCAIWGESLNSTVTYTDTDWHHVACTFDADTRLMTLYRDGEQVNQYTAGDLYSGFGGTFIGKRFDNTGYFGGSIDEVAIWTQALTSNQILDLFQKVRVEDQSVLHAVLPVQEDADLTTLDLILRETATGAGAEAQVVTRTIGIDADSPSATILAPTADAYVSGLQALEISGSATDPTSYVTDAEVQVDGGSWLEASGTESWSYTIPAGTLSDGLHTVSARATDIVGNAGAASSVQFIVDDTPPDIGFDSSGTALPRRDEEGRWIVLSITGQAGDPPAGTQPGSGLVSVEVLMEGGPNVVGNGWQTATLQTDGFWTIDYVLPEVGTGGVEVGDPSGSYTILVRATDAVNNTTPENEYVTGPLSLETNPPLPTLVTTLPLTQPITTSIVITGEVVDDWPIAEMEIGFTPGSNIDALGEAVLHLPFDETYTSSQYFSDRSGSNNPAGCREDVCPLAGQTGQRDQALEFDGLSQHAVIEDNDSIDFGTDEDFTVAVWVYADPNQPNTGNTDNDIVEKWSGGGGYPFVIRYFNQTGQIRAARYDGTNNPGIDSIATINDGLFHHVAFVKQGETLSLYIDGALDGTALDTTTGDTTNNVDLYLGMRGNNINHFKGLLDELIIHDRALEEYEIADLYEYGLTTWYSATVDNSTSPATWSFTIPEGENGLEGIFQINARATDDLGYVTPYENQRVWRGEIDTRPPTLVFTATAGALSTAYTCDATDFNLDEDTSCLVVPPDIIPDFGNGSMTLTTYDLENLWYAAVISDTTRLYNMFGALTLAGSQPISMSLQACDAYGRCTTSSANTAVLTTPTEQPAAPLVDLTLGAEVFTPTNGTVLTITTPISISGAAFAETGLQVLSVSVDGVEAHNQTWPASPVITNTVWSFTWTPPGQGSYVLETAVQDWSGNAVTGTLSPTIHVDTEPPTISITPTVLTTTHQLGEEIIRLTGIASDTVQLYRVQVRVDSAPWQRAGLANDGSWQWPWQLDSQPDGEAFSVSARATDLADQTTVQTESVWVDILPPEPVTVTLAYTNDQSQVLPIAPGDTLTDAISLQMSWTASSDGSGLTAYLAGWSQSATPLPAELTAYPGAGAHAQVTGEAETWYAHLQIVDGVGNITTQTLGPVYVDGFFTPDEINALSYHGWANEVCALEGVDRRLPQTHPTLYADDLQRFYVSWDETALRLYWQGANWNHDGDLFVYLDTRPGGSDRLYNPYPESANTTIYLPGNLPNSAGGVGQRQQNAQTSITAQARLSAVGADYMVWIEDAEQATLYRWDGYAWKVAQELDGNHFRLNVGITSSDTDLRLPFAELGIADPTIAALGLLAVATEEQALRLWSTMPVRNPVNSDRAVNPVAGLTEEHTFPLVRGYFWDSLGSGVCGNGRLNNDGSGPLGGSFADSDLRLSISADPVGTTYSFMNDELAWLWSLLFGFETLPVVPSQLFSHQDTSHPPLGPGQTVTFTINYENLGTEAATGVTIDLTAWYSLRLSGDSTLVVGDIPPGAVGSVQVGAFIDPTGVDAQEQEWAALDAFVYDDQHPENPTGGSWSSAPLEWMWSDHRVDTKPPSSTAITAPDFVIPAGSVTIQGIVVDESAVPTIHLEALNNRGHVETISCIDNTPTDGRWSCAWDTSGAADGDTFQVRAQAIDIFGQAGDWTDWANYEVDATAPIFSIADTAPIYGPGIHHLNGSFVDERQIGYIHICREDGECDIQTVMANPIVPPGTLAYKGLWAAYLLAPPGSVVDGQPQTITLFGSDAAGNRSETITVTYKMDNTPPKLTVTQAANQVPAIGAHLILSGTVLDGSQVDVNVLVDPPGGGRQRLKASVAGDNWSFTHTWATPGAYTLWVQAIDAADNTTTAGPFTVLVDPANRIYFPVVLQKAALIPPAVRSGPRGGQR